jgi:hypothetical protein
MKKDSGQNDADPSDPWVEAASRLPREIAPERDLWPGIAARLEPGDRTRAIWRGWHLAGAVAAAVALVTVSSLITLWVTDRPDSVPVSRVQTPAGIARPARALNGNATFGPDYLLGPKYEKARQQLSQDLDTQLETLPPETREVIEKNLAQIRQALTEINGALADDPGNVLLQQLLMAAYQDELTVLMEVNRMARSLPTRKEI